MIKVTYINKLDQSKQESLFQNQTDLEAHQAIFPYMYNNSYKEIIPEVYDVIPEQIIPGKEAVLDENGNIIEEAVLEQIIPEVKTLIQEEQQIAHENTMQVIITDISAEILQQKNIDKYLKRIQFGQVLMAELASINKAKLESGAYSPDQVLTLKKSLAPIKDFVSEGSLGFAYQTLNMSQDLPKDLTLYFLGKISDYLESEE